ncbi:hypothetical protein Avbf_17446 [Armadillidium vulgare]|nr:hypothetical protein Avbf_17446 [Armadillidium vulgare]
MYLLWSCYQFYMRSCKMLKPSNITEYPRQENNSLEETILNGVEVNPNPQFDASLTSEYSDMSADKASSENLLNDIVNESTNSVSTQASNFRQIQFSLPSFSPALADYLQDRRRKQVTRKEGKVFVCETTSVDEAYNLMQTLPLKLWQHTQLKKGAFHNKGSSISLASRGDSTRLSFGRFYCII